METNFPLWAKWLIGGAVAASVVMASWYGLRTVSNQNQTDSKQSSNAVLTEEGDNKDSLFERLLKVLVAKRVLEREEKKTSDRRQEIEIEKTETETETKTETEKAGDTRQGTEDKSVVSGHLPALRSLLLVESETGEAGLSAVESQLTATLTATPQTDGRVEVKIFANAPISVKWNGINCSVNNKISEFKKDQTFILSVNDINECQTWNVSTRSKGGQEVAFKLETSTDQMIIVNPPVIIQPPLTLTASLTSTPRLNGELEVRIVSSFPVKINWKPDNQKCVGDSINTFSTIHSINFSPNQLVCGSWDIEAISADNQKVQFNVSGYSSTTS